MIQSPACETSLPAARHAVVRRPERLEQAGGLDHRLAVVVDRDEDDEHDHPDPDQDVADREDVGEGEPGGKREDVAEEPEPGGADEDVLVNARRKAVGARGAGRDGHQPVVGDDRGRVRHQAEQHRNEHADTEVGGREGEQEHVARDVQPLDRDLVEPLAQLAEDDQLEDERDGNRPRQPEAHLDQAARPAAEQHREDDPEDEARQEEHQEAAAIAGGSCSGASACAGVVPVNVDSSSSAQVSRASESRRGGRAPSARTRKPAVTPPGWSAIAR